MLTINSSDLIVIEDALNRPEDTGAREKARAVLARVREFIATPELLDEAQEIGANIGDEEDRISFDDEASTSPSDEGTFVQCWIWVPAARCEDCDEVLDACTCEAESDA